MTEMTKQVLYYQATGKGLDELRQAIAIRIYYFPKRYAGMSRDDRGDFLLFSYPIIVSIIERFRFIGSPFEAYLKSILRKRIWTYKFRRRRLDVLNTIGQSDVGQECLRQSSEADVMSVCDNEASVYSKGGNMKELGLSNSPSTKRRLIMLTLKNCNAIHSDQIARIAELADVSADWLATACLQVRACLQRRFERMSMIRRRRNMLYIRIMATEYAMHEGAFHPIQREFLQGRLAAMRKYIAAARETLAHIPRTPTNWDIALILGIPKGTVDSGLFYLKQKLCAYQSDKEEAGG